MIDAAALLALAAKYEALHALRVARAARRAPPEAPVFKDLARTFPGCLQELDTLPLETLAARAAELRVAARSGEVAPWMEWLAGYHALLRAALWIKARARRATPLDADALALAASAAAGVTLDADFVRAVASPPEGRLVPLVFAALARRHDRPAAEIKRALFPAARR